MSDFLDALIIIRDGVVALTDLLHALDSIDTDEIVVNVDQSVLPPLAATTTNQATAITALQKLDDLQDALESKALDRLLVRGTDQLFSIKNVLTQGRTAIISGAGGFIDSRSCYAGEYWVVTTVYAYDATSPCTAIYFQNRHDAVGYGFHWRAFAFPAATPETWSGLTVLDPSDTIRVYFPGALAGDTCHIDITGYRVTLET